MVIQPKTGVHYEDANVLEIITSDNPHHSEAWIITRVVFDLTWLLGRQLTLHTHKNNTLARC
jgi:hypothetical protein